MLCRKNNAAVLSLAVALVVAIFGIDLLVPLDVGVPMMYAAVVLLTLWSADRRLPLTPASLCTLLTFLDSFFTSTSQIELEEATLWRQAWIVAALC